MFVDGEEKQGPRLAVEIGEVGAFEGCVRGQGRRVGKVEAEGETALEPRFDSVAVGRDDLWRRSAGERGEVLIKEFGGEGVRLTHLSPAEDRDGQQDRRGERRPGRCADGGDPCIPCFAGRCDCALELGGETGEASAVVRSGGRRGRWRL